MVPPTRTAVALSQGGDQRTPGTNAAMRDDSHMLGGEPPTLLTCRRIDGTRCFFGHPIINISTTAKVQADLPSLIITNHQQTPTSNPLLS